MNNLPASDPKGLTVTLRKGSKPFDERIWMVSEGFRILQSAIELSRNCYNKGRNN